METAEQTEACQIFSNPTYHVCLKSAALRPTSARHLFLPCIQWTEMNIRVHSCPFVVPSHLFKCKQFAFYVQSPRITSQTAVGPHDAMARNDDENRIATNRVSDRPRRCLHPLRFIQPPRQLAISRCLAIRDCPQQLPYLHSEHRALRHQREGLRGRPFSCKIIIKPTAYIIEQRQVRPFHCHGQVREMPLTIDIQPRQLASIGNQRQLSDRGIMPCDNHAASCSTVCSQCHIVPHRAIKSISHSPALPFSSASFRHPNQKKSKKYLQNPFPHVIYYCFPYKREHPKTIRNVAQPGLARLTGGQKVESSNLSVPTIHLP